MIFRILKKKWGHKRYNTQKIDVNIKCQQLAPDNGKGNFSDRKEVIANLYLKFVRINGMITLTA